MRPEVERADGGDLGVAARRLPVGEQHDGLALADDLDPAHRHAVGDDVVAAGVLDERPLEPRAHAVALRQHLVRAARGARRCPPAVKRSSCGPEHHRAPWPPPVRRARAGVAGRGGRAAAAGPERQPVAACAARGPRGRPAGRARRSRASRAPAACRGRPPPPGRRARPPAAGPSRSTSPAFSAHRLPRRDWRRRSRCGDMSAPVTATSRCVGQLEARADQRALERGRAVRVADQPVGEHERLAVHRARGRDADAQVPEAARGPGWW